jgi:hypothetical protein
MIDNLEKDKFEKPKKLLENLATGTIRYIYEYLIKEQLHPVEFTLFTLTVCKDIYCSTLKNCLLLTETERMMLTQKQKKHFEHSKELVLSIHKKILESLQEATEKTIKNSEDIEDRHTKYVVDKE